MGGQSPAQEAPNLLVVEDESAQISEKLAQAHPQPPPITSGDTQQNVAAYRLYLKGRYYAVNAPRRLRKALQLFRQAIELDPTHALAYVAWPRAMRAGGLLPRRPA